MVVEVVNDFFLDMPDLERVCMGWVERETAGFFGFARAGFSGFARAGETVKIFGEEKVAGWVVFKVAG
jgi:hypothetical protein